MTLKQHQRFVDSLGHPKPPHKLLRQHQSAVMRYLPARIALQMELRLAHHPSSPLGPWKFIRIDAGPRIDVTCALKWGRYFHLEPSTFSGYVVVLQLFVYLILEGFSRLVLFSTLRLSR